MRKEMQKERSEGEERERAVGETARDRTDETPRLIFDSSTILFFTAAKNRDKVADAETQITLDALYYYEDDPCSKKPNLGEWGSSTST